MGGVGVKGVLRTITHIALLPFKKLLFTKEKCSQYKNIRQTLSCKKEAKKCNLYNGLIFLTSLFLKAIVLVIHSNC